MRISFVLALIASFSFLLMEWSWDLQLDFVGSSKQAQEINLDRFTRLKRDVQSLLDGMVSDLETHLENEADTFFPYKREALCLIARRSRISKRIGELEQPELKDGWEKQLILGLRKGGRLFEQKFLYFAPRSMRWEVFQKKRGTLIEMFRKGKPYWIYYQKAGSYTVFAVFDRAMMEESYLKPPVSLSSQNSFAVFPFGLNFQMKQFVWVPVLGVLFYLLSKSLIFRILVSRFSRKFALFYFSLLTLLASFLVVHLQGILDVQRYDLRRELNNQIQQSLKDYEAAFSQHLQQYARNSIETFNKRKSFEDLGEIYELKAAWFSEKNIHRFLPERPPFFFKQFLLRMGPKVMCQRRRTRGEIEAFGLDDCEEEITQVYSEKHEYNSEVQSRLSLGDGVRAMFNEGRQGALQEYETAGMSNGYFWTNFIDSNGEEQLILFVTRVGKLKNEYSLKFPKVLESQLMSRGERIKAGVLEESDEHGQTEKMSFQVKSDFLSRTYFVRVDRSTLYSGVNEFEFRFYLLLVSGLVFAIPSWFFMSRSLVEPLMEIRRVLGGILRRKYQKLEVRGKDEYARLMASLNNMVDSLEEKNRLAPFVADEIITLMSDENGQLRKRVDDEAVVLFSDIRSFTTISETNPPEEIVQMLNEYFELWQNCIQKHGGVIERFIGDAVVAVFLKSLDPYYMQSSVQASLDLMEQLKGFNEKREEKGQFLVRNGVGLSSGETRLLVLGDESKRHLVTVGDCVSKAEELEAITKDGKYTKVFVDETVYNNLRHTFDFEKFDEDVFEVRA